MNENVLTIKKRFLDFTSPTMFKGIKTMSENGVISWNCSILFEVCCALKSNVVSGDQLYDLSQACYGEMVWMKVLLHSLTIPSSYQIHFRPDTYTQFLVCVRLVRSEWNARLVPLFDSQSFDGFWIILGFFFTYLSTALVFKSLEWLA